MNEFWPGIVRTSPEWEKPICCEAQGKASSFHLISCRLGTTWFGQEEERNLFFLPLHSHINLCIPSLNCFVRCSICQADVLFHANT